MDVPQARRIERPGWINARTVLGLLLFSSAVLGGQRIIEGARATQPVWTVAQDLPSGAVISADDLTTSEIAASAEMKTRYAFAGTDLIGAVVVRPISAGEMVPLGSVAPPGTPVDGRAVTIPVAPEHAVGGAISPGDLIDVFVTSNAGAPEARTSLLVSGAEVTNVIRSEGVVVGDGEMIGLTVLTSSADAERIVHAIRSGEIDVALVRGAAEGGS